MKNKNENTRIKNFSWCFCFIHLEKGTFISSLSGCEEEYYLNKNVWSSSAADWKQRFEVGEVVADPAGDWEPSTAEEYIDQQIGIEASTRLAQDTYIQSQIPLADEEDLTKSGNYLKFKDRTYNQVSPNGMGKVILRNNIVNGVNTLTQNMINQASTIYVIRYDFTLGEDITVLANCVLEFDGGSISGAYTITGANTGISAGLVKIFNTSVTLTGTWNVAEVYPEWFGAVGDGVTDDILAIQAAVDNARLQRSGICNVKLLYKRNYKISAPIRIPTYMRFGGMHTSINTVDDDEKATITANGTNAINLYGLDYNEALAPSRIFIYDLVIYGSTYIDYSGISTVANCPGVGSVSIDGVLLGGFKFGINFSGSRSICYAKIKNVATSSYFPIGIGVYINCQIGIYTTDISNCTLYHTKIGGIYMNTAGQIVGPVDIVDTTFEGCGYNYDMDFLNEYGSWGLFIQAAERSIGSVNIKNCYFEANCPERSYGDGTLNNDNPYGFIEATNTNHTGIYITNPNYKKTAEIIISAKNLNVIVIDSNITADYQPVSIVDYGILTFKDNTLYSRNALGDRLGVRQKSIVKIFDETNSRSCQYIGVNIENLNCCRESISLNNLDYLEQTIELVNTEVSGNSNNVTTANATLNINCELLGEKYTYRTKNTDPDYGAHAYIYINPNAPYNGIGSIGDPCPSFGWAISRLRYSYDTKEVTFVLLDNITVIDGGYSGVFPAGKIYNFFPHKSSIKTITFNGSGHFQFYNSDVLLDKVGVTTTDATIKMHNGTLTVRGYSSAKAPITIGKNNNVGLCWSYGNVNFVCEYCTFTTDDGTLERGAINYKETGKVYTFLVNCDNTLDIPVVDDSNA